MEPATHVAQHTTGLPVTLGGKERPRGRSDDRTGLMIAELK